MAANEMLKKMSTDLSLSKKRMEIDEIDRKLILLLGQRFKLIQTIRKIKNKLKIPVYDKCRETQLLLRAIQLVEQHENKKEILKIYNITLKKSLNCLKKINN